MVQGTWTPTRPRRPVAAEFQTPGPGSCNIPSTIGKCSPGRGGGQPHRAATAPYLHQTTGKVVIIISLLEQR